MSLDSSATPPVQIRSIRTTFAEFRLAVDDFSLRPGLTCLIGPNGAGKTTLIRVLAGESIGEVEGHTINGVAVQDLGHDLASRVQVVRDSLRAVEGLTVGQLLALARAAHGERWRDERAECMIERLGLTLRRRVRDLSRGNAVKLQLVLAEACEPEVLLLDEPTAGLDPFVRGELLELVAEVVSCHPNRALLLATHLLDDVVIDATGHVIVLGEGRVRYSPTPDELEALRSATGSARAAMLLQWYPAFARQDKS